jgi:hypothetical protein
VQALLLWRFGPLRDAAGPVPQRPDFTRLAIKPALTEKETTMSYKSTKQPADTKKGPIDEIRVNGCKVTVWENKTDKGVRHNVTFERSYLDSENKWQTTNSYGLSELLAHRAAVDLAINRLIEARNGTED